jgi:hypothetical protein
MASQTTTRLLLSAHMPSTWLGDVKRGMMWKTGSRLKESFEKRPVRSQRRPWSPGNPIHPQYLKTPHSLNEFWPTPYIAVECRTSVRHEHPVITCFYCCGAMEKRDRIETARFVRALWHCTNPKCGSKYWKMYGEITRGSKRDRKRRY